MEGEGDGRIWILVSLWWTEGNCSLKQGHEGNKVKFRSSVTTLLSNITTSIFPIYSCFDIIINPFQACY